MKIENENAIQNFKDKLIKFCPEFKSVIEPLQIKKVITDALNFLGYGQVFIHAIVPGQKKVSHLTLYILPPTKGNENLCYLSFHDARERLVKAASASIKRLPEFINPFQEQNFNWLNQKQRTILNV